MNLINFIFRDCLESLYCYVDARLDWQQINSFTQKQKLVNHFSISLNPTNRSPSQSTNNQQPQAIHQPQFSEHPYQSKSLQPFPQSQSSLQPLLFQPQSQPQLYSNEISLNFCEDDSDFLVLHDNEKEDLHDIHLSKSIKTKYV